MKRVIGHYNEQGYQVETDNIGGFMLYQAGNHALDSQQNGTGTEHQLPLETIKQHCEQTTREIARKRHARYGGIRYVDWLED